MPTAKSLQQVQMIKPSRPIQQSPPAKSTQTIKAEIPPIRSALEHPTKLLQEFAFSLLCNFQSYGIFKHLFKRGRPLLRTKTHIAPKQCRPLDGLGCMWASFRNVSY